MKSKERKRPHNRENFKDQKVRRRFKKVRIRKKEQIKVVEL